MRHYKTLNQVKQDLPQIIDRINTCKVMFDCSTMMLKDMERWCVTETTENIDHGWWTTLPAYAETVKNQMSYLAEIEYLQSLVDKIQQYRQV